MKPGAKPAMMEPSLLMPLGTRICEVVQPGQTVVRIADEASPLVVKAPAPDRDARRICEWAVRKNRQVSVRLVKGAYWDYQVIHAEQMGWPCPVWPTKRQTDACFEKMTDIYLDACPRSAGSLIDGRGPLVLAARRYSDRLSSRSSGSCQHAASAGKLSGPPAYTRRSAPPRWHSHSP